MAYTTFRNHTSTKRQFKSGVPQGGILSLILFNIYTSDIPLPPDSVQLSTYADDITITAPHTDINITNQIQNPFLTAQSTQIKSVISVPIKDFIHHYPRALFNDIPRVGTHFNDIPGSGRTFTTIQPYLQDILKWTKDNDLLLNTDKTTCTLLTPDPAEYNTQLGLQIDNTTLPISTHPKTLGLTLDPKLTYNRHIDLAATKAC